MDAVLHVAQRSLSGMNPLDWVVVVTLAVSTVMAFMRGLILSVLSLAGLVVGVLAAATYAAPVARYLQHWFGAGTLALAAAFLLVLVAVCMAASLLGRLLRGFCSVVGLGFLDRLAGAVFGFARGVLLLAALILPLLPYLQGFAVAQSSTLLPYLLPAAHGISFVMPRHLAGTLFSVDTFLGDMGRSTTRVGGNQPEASR